MLTDCPSCLRSYQVSRAALGGSGRTVICPGCQSRWYVAVPDDGSVERDTPPKGNTYGRVAGRSASPPHRSLSDHRPLAAVLICLGLAAGAIGERTAIVEACPRSATLYAAVGLPVNVRKLAFGEIRTIRLENEPQRVAISGQIRNVAHTRIAVPRMAFDLRDARGTVLASWSGNAPKRMLAANETVAFTTEAPPLPEGYKDVVVHFADREAAPSLLGKSPGDRR